MNTYTVSFTGHYPVGACAVVVAKDRGHAKRLLNQLLQQKGLKPVEDSKDVKPLRTDVANATILNDGNY